MKKLWPYLFILLTVGIFFHPFFLKGLLPIPADTIVGLYHPFRDSLAKDYPRGVPFKNFLITDPVRQQYPWRNLSIQLEKQMQLPLWNPYNFAGMPLLANQQSAVFYPLNVVFLFLPFSFAWGILVLLQPLLSGSFLYLYLRSLRLEKISALLGSMTFAFSGFVVSWMEWNTVVHTLLWLPMLLLSIDKIYIQKKNKIVWYSVYFFSILASFFAGHLQAFFYVLIVTHVYLLLRWIKNDRKLINFFWGIGFGLGAMILASIQLLPLIQLITLSARNIDQNYLTAQGWFLPWQNIVQFLAPDFFGNPTTLNYWGVWNYAEFVGYIGIVPLLLAVFAIFFRKDKKTLLFALIGMVGLLFALPNPISRLPYDLQIPFLSSSQPTRLMGIIDFSLSILAALGLNYFLKKNQMRIAYILGIAGVVFVCFWFYVVRFHVGISYENSLVAKQNLILPTVTFICGTVILTAYLIFKQKKVRISILALLFLLIAFDLLRFATKFTPFTSQVYLFPPEKTLHFLQDNIGRYRYMTTDSRIMAPNFSIMYKLQSVDGYDPLYLRSYGEFVAALERDKPDIHAPFGFNRIVTPHNYGNPLMNLLGVKYVLTFDEMQTPGFEKVFEEGQTKVYQNKNVYPRAFFVENVFVAGSKQKAIEYMYQNSKNLLRSAVVTQHMTPTNFQSDRSDVSIRHYNENRIEIDTKNSAIGFLVLTDIFYPTWYAYIDDKETKIYSTDFTFRGVIVPKGNHKVVFQNRLL